MQSSVTKKLLLFTLLMALSLRCLWAYADDAHSLAMEVAYPMIENGFEPREDYWKGKVGKTGTHRIEHQLFKGNEYWFWLGSSDEKASVQIRVYDSQGNAVETKKYRRKGKGKGMAAAHFVPSKTGKYTIIIKVKPKASKRDIPNPSWAVVYGYK